MLKHKKLAIITSSIILISLVYFGERLINVQAAAQSSLPVFPGAVGHGRFTYGGSGRHLSTPHATIYRIDTLSCDSAPIVSVGDGSFRTTFRTALAQTHPKTIIFEVSGIIDCGNSAVSNQGSYVTIAGQTAPGPGIWIRSAKVSSKDKSHILIQHMTFGNSGDWISDRDPLAINGTINNIYLDHISTRWANDESLELWGSNDLTTIAWSTFTEALNHRHPESPSPGSGGHSAGPMIMSAMNTTFAYNLIALNDRRNPRFATPFGPSKVEMVNNIIYGYAIASASGASSGGAGGSVIASQGQMQQIDMISNLYRTHATLSPSTKGIKTIGSGNIELYTEGNISPDWSSPNSPSDWSGVTGSTSNRSLSRVTVPSNVTIYGANDLMNVVLPKVGPRPAGKDPVAARVVNHVINRDGKLVLSHENEVGGYPYPLGVIQSKRTLALPDNPDGLSDVCNTDGTECYTNLEVWLSEFSAQVEGIGGNAVCGNGAVEPPGEQCDDGNTVSGDGCSSACQLESTDEPADLDKDGDVDIFDYNILIGNFGNTSCGNAADIDGNCKVDIFDYNILVENFGVT